VLLLGTAVLASVAGCFDRDDRTGQLMRIAHWEDRRLAPADSLSRAIHSDDAHIRLAAVRAAGLIGRDDVLADLLATLEDPSTTIRQHAAFSLGLLDNPQAVPALRTAAASEYRDLRIAALEGLAHLEHDGSVFVQAALHGETIEAIAAWNGLRNVADHVPRDLMIETIQAGLSRQEDEILWRILRCAERAPDSTLVAQIAPFTRAKSAQVRVHANRALSQLGGLPGNGPALNAVLDGCEDSRRFGRRDRSRIRIAQLRALGRLAGTMLARQEGTEISSAAARITGALIAGARDEDPHVARTAFTAMTTATTPLRLPPEAVERLSLLPVWRIRLVQMAQLRLADPEGAIRAAAIRAYGTLRGAGALPQLHEAVSDTIAMVRDAAWLTYAEQTTGDDPDTVGDLDEALYRTDAITSARLEAVNRLWQRRAQLLAPTDTTGLRRRTHHLLLQATAAADFVIVATAAPLLVDFPGEQTVEALLHAYHGASGEGTGDIRLAVLDAVATLAGSGEEPETEPATHWLSESWRARIAAALQHAFDSRDLRIRLRARAVAAQTGLVPELLIPSVASLKATLPAHERNLQQAPLTLPFDAPDVRCLTDRGAFVMRLDGRTAPNTVAGFLDLIREGFYHDLIWHRVVPDFVVQGGCPRGDGWGGPGFTIRSEWSRLPYARTAVGIAHSGKDTGGCQFFLTLSPQPHLNGRYTVFGEVIDGMDVVDTIQPGERFRLTIVE